MLHFSAKGEYGVLAILALSLHSDRGPLQVKSIAQKERIPVRFLEQVMSLLKKKGLVESVRGPHGGYLLTKSPDQIRLGEVLQAIEGPVASIEPASNRKNASYSSAGEIENKILKDVWAQANSSLETFLNSISFKDLCEKKKELEGRPVLMFHI
jgi:Rrf2 family transcriptional regulator, cysteine metabolism repressor